MSDSPDESKTGGMVNSLERDENRVLIALFIDHHREDQRLLAWRDMEAEYHVKVDERRFNAIVTDLESREIVLAVRDKDGVAVLLKDAGYKPALSAILKYLDADTFEVSWKTERILTDASDNMNIPSPNGWMLMTVKKDGPAPAKSVQADTAAPHWNAHINWTKWGTILTGLGLAITLIALLAG